MPSQELIRHEDIPADQADEVIESEPVREYPPVEEYTPIAPVLSVYANKGDGVSTMKRMPAGVDRQAITRAFNDAFELIGGVMRLAHWAHEHPSDFYKLYARMLPSSAQQQIEHSGEILIRHAIPRTELDE